MPWFKVDDGFANSEPVMRVPRRYRASVIGLWTLSGTWCAKELTDGRVPVHMIEELAGTTAQAAWLVTAGLWAETPEGYEFIGWDKYQPTRAEVEESRRKEAERKARYRMSRRDTPGTPPSVPQVSQQESGHPDPTRPDPTIKKSKSNVQAALERDFDSFWEVYPRKEGKQAAKRKYITVRRTTPAEPILEGAKSYALMSLGKEKQHIKMAQGWLNDGRWADEVQTSVPLPRRASDEFVHTHKWMPDGSCLLCEERLREEENPF